MKINNKPRIIIWFVTNDGQYISSAIKILNQQFNGVEVFGVTSKQKIVVKDSNGKELPFIPLNEINLNGGGYDILLCVGARNIGMSEVIKLAKSSNLDIDKLLGDWIVCIPGFTLEKYRQLQQSNLSIFSISCFGGMLSHTLGLPFRSPFVNMFLHEDEYIKFLWHPRKYMDEELIFRKTCFEKTLKINYPVFNLGDVSLYMNHYSDFDEAVAKWNERKQRINWYNLFVTMFTETPEILSKFDELPYEKKVCFVPFRSKLNSAFYVNVQFRPTQHYGSTFGLAINDYGIGNPYYYHRLLNLPKNKFKITDFL